MSRFVESRGNRVTIVPRRRAAATALDHIAVEGSACIYCGAPVSPCVTRSGNTRNLDHFVPIEIVLRAREALPALRIVNWLLPSCPICNNLAGQYYFPTLAEKVAFVQWKRHPELRMPEWAGVPLSAPPALAAVIRPLSEYQPGDYLILAPVRLESGNWSVGQPHAEKVLQCNSQTTLSVLSKMEFSFSRATGSR